jgi:hypothetical protein
MKHLAIAALVLTACLGFTSLAAANGTYQTLPYFGGVPAFLITTSDDWSAVPGMIGFRGDGLTAATGVDPQTLTLEDTTPVVDVTANLLLATDPNTFTTGGVADFDWYAAVALSGSGTADAPYLQLHLNTTGMEWVYLTYSLIDLDASADNAVQQVALHYRVGNTGPWTNVPDGYVADATQGPSLSGLTTPVVAYLPADAWNVPQVQVRIMTTNAVGNDEWVAINDIQIYGSDIPVPNDKASWGSVKSSYQK